MGKRSGKQRDINTEAAKRTMDVQTANKKLQGKLKLLKLLREDTKAIVDLEINGSTDQFRERN